MKLQCNNDSVFRIDQLTFPAAFMFIKEQLRKSHDSKVLVQCWAGKTEVLLLS